jgi:hypothetical protein
MDCYTLVGVPRTGVWEHALSELSGLSIYIIRSLILVKSVKALTTLAPPCSNQ